MSKKSNVEMITIADLIWTVIERGNDGMVDYTISKGITKQGTTVYVQEWSDGNSSNSILNIWTDNPEKPVGFIMPPPKNQPTLDSFLVWPRKLPDGVSEL